MSENEKKTGLKWLEKLKKIKHIEIYIAIIFIVILLLIYMSNFSNSKSDNNDLNTDTLTVSAYIDRLETNLEETLSNIGGVSDVKVMITLNMSDAEVTDSTINLNKFPEIKGVIVTAKGVNDTSTKMKVLHAIEAVIDIENGNIEILSSE